MEKCKKRYNYFYIINNLLDGHFYLGVHSTDDLDDGYFGSGTVLGRAIKKYGIKNFELTILKYFDTRAELMTFEREVVNERFLEYYKGICYNLKKGGEGGSVKRFTDKEWKEHKRELDRKWNKNNKERKRELDRKWNENNKERRREYNRKWNENNKERKRELNRRAKKKAASVATT